MSLRSIIPLVNGASPSFATLTLTGAALTQNNVVVNTSTAYTIDAANGASFQLTMNSATPTLTLGTAPTEYQELYVQLIQDGTGGRDPTFANVTWAAGAAPAILQDIASITYLKFVGAGSVWTGFAANQNFGIIDGSAAPSGYIGEVVTSTIASGSAVSLTTATVTEITHIDLSPGCWELRANLIFVGTGITSTELQGLIATASGTSVTGQVTANTLFCTPFLEGGSTSTSGAIPTWQQNITSATSYYLKAKATFTVGTCTGYGSITATRIR